MDQIKIGKFIKQKRTEKNIKQWQLSEILGISNRAVSKWETGKCLPDASIMASLTDILGITINDLFSGEVVDMKNYEEKAESNLLELAKKEEITNKNLLLLEVVLIIIGFISFILMMVSSDYVTGYLKYLLIGGAILILVTILIIAEIIEKDVGYYECGKCHHKYIPTYKQTLMCVHCGWTKYLKCPKCKEKSWNKKVLTK